MQNLSKLGLFIVVASQFFLSANSQTLVNGSFENGFDGWTTNAGVQISPFPDLPASQGTNCVHLGIYNITGSVLSQNFPVVPGTSNRLAFDLLALIDNRIATVTIVRVELVAASGILVSQTFTNTGRNTPPLIYQTLSVPFTVPTEVSSLTLRFIDLTPNSGIAADPILDNVRILPQLPSAPSVLAGPITNLANGHKYYLLTGTNWTASQAQAVALGGNLVTINNADEHAWVYSTFSSFAGIPRALWIGLSDYLQEGNFVWADGQTSAYRNWSTFEPNGYDSNEDFAHIFPPNDHLNRGGKWNDYGNVTHVIYDTHSVPLHGVVEIDGVTNPPVDCIAQVGLLTAQLAAANTSNATLRSQILLLQQTNRNLLQQISSLQRSNTLLRVQLANATNLIAELRGKLASATNTIAATQERLAAAQAANATLQFQVAAADAQNQELRNQLSDLDQSITLLEDFFAEQFNNPAFVIPGATTELQVSNLVSAIQRLNPGQQQALMNLLSGARRRTLR